MTDGVKGTTFIALSPLFVLFPLSPPPFSQVGLAVFGYEGTPLYYKLLLALCQAWSGSDKPCPAGQTSLALPVSFLVSLTLLLAVSVGCHLGLFFGGSCWGFFIPELDYILFLQSRMDLGICCAFG